MNSNQLSNEDSEKIKQIKSYLRIIDERDKQLRTAIRSKQAKEKSAEKKRIQELIELGKQREREKEQIRQTKFEEEYPAFFGHLTIINNQIADLETQLRNLKKEKFELQYSFRPICIHRFGKSYYEVGDTLEDCELCCFVHCIHSVSM